jgi:hypothetical protein
VRSIMIVLLVACRAQSAGVDASVAATVEAGPPPPSVCDRPPSCPNVVVDATTRITLERAACFGRCPVYTVTIAGDGTVTWTGKANVDVATGTAKIPQAKVQELADLLASSCFFAMQDRYNPPVTDLPSVTTSATIGGATKSVTHRGAGMLPEDARGVTDPRWCPPPKALATIDARIDEIADTQQWIGKGERTFPPPAPSGCNPPYTIQRNGTKIFKPECVR